MKHLFAFFAFLAICCSAGAISIESPSTVYLYDEAKDVSIRIVNEEEIAQDFSIEFSAPTQFELSQYNGTVAGDRSKTVTLTLYPRSDLVGQTYESKLEVTLGSKKYVKLLHLVFRGEKEEALAAEQPEEITIGLFALASPEFALNIALALIAAILLIAFIARLVRRMEGR